MIERIRNFSIIAHVDHGKSTLADRFLELCGALSAREMSDQVLDDMELERERGITIKARSVTLEYRARDGAVYELNMIDTPGHVDFSYEVSRSLAACDGALLVVDATQGVEAQTLANSYLAVDGNLAIVPVINKIDLPSASIEGAREQIENIIGIDAHDALPMSAKSGEGVPEVLEAIVSRIPPPRGDASAPLKALLFDSWFDSYRGVVVLVRIFDGVLRKGMRLRLFAAEERYEALEIGVFRPKPEVVPELSPGQVGYLVAGIKRISDTKIGDTITEEGRPTAAALPGFREIKPMVFSGLYPADPADYEALKAALEKLRLNDASFLYEPETSNALGFGYRCGFLGLLHMEIIQERLEREFDLTLVTTAPSVRYQVFTTAGEMVSIDNPKKLPPTQSIARMEEPFICASILTDSDYVGAILKLAEERRGVQKGLEYLTPKKVLITYDLPLNEIVLDFYDKLKSASRGYASLDYQLAGYREADLVRVDILVNGESVDALSMICHRDGAAAKGRALLSKMKELIPRQLFEVILQAAIGAKIIARETVKPLRKNVLAKCYGGDITRKRKLLEKQKEGKKRMKKVGRVEIPQEAFLAVLKVE
ncbi:MAG: translation elongation factor 4 [Acidobacteriota bacterium]